MVKLSKSEFGLAVNESSLAILLQRKLDYLLGSHAIISQKAFTETPDANSKP